MDEFLTPELVAGLGGGLVVALGLLVLRGLGWLKDVIQGTPTKLDDKIYNKVREAFAEAGAIPVEDPPAGGKDKTTLRSPLVAAGLALGLALLLSACSFSEGIGDLEDLPFGVAPEAPDEPAAAQKRLADEIFGAVEGQEGRTARLALVMASYSELAADRIVRFDPEQAAVALGRFLELRGILARFSANSDSVFIETDLRHASLAIAGIVIETGLERGQSFAGNLIGGINFAGLKERTRVAARQAALTEALLTDVRAAVARISEDPGTIEDIRTAAVARFDANEARIMALLGAASRASPAGG